MKGLRNSNIQDFFDGNQWIIIRRKKTATSSNVILLDIPKMIIEKYAGFSKDGKVFFDGNQWIIIRRKKTATSSNVILLDIPKMIIEKYAGFSKDGKVFPVPSNTFCNDSLKRISQLIDCLKEKKVTFHLARHTFATLFLSEGVPLESLSKMLGHKNIATTQIYAKILNEKVGKDMQKVSINLRVWKSHLWLNYKPQ